MAAFALSFGRKQIKAHYTLHFFERVEGFDVISNFLTLVAEIFLLQPK